MRIDFSNTDWAKVFVVFVEIPLLILVSTMLFTSIIPVATTTGVVRAVTPDTQVTYNIITIQSSYGTFNETVSCTGNFQFTQNLIVSVNEYHWVLFWFNHQRLNELPAGCIMGN